MRKATAAQTTRSKSLLKMHLKLFCRFLELSRSKRPKPSLKIGSVTKAFLFWYWQQLKKVFFRNKTFLFFKIESWNFQHLFEIEFCETSIRQSMEKMKMIIVWISGMSWNFERYHEIIFQKMLKVSALYLEKQKSFIHKKDKNWPNFQWRFWSRHFFYFIFLLWCCKIVLKETLWWIHVILSTLKRKLLCGTNAQWGETHFIKLVHILFSPFVRKKCSCM